MELVKPIFILGCHKSGTSLVRSLLDAHPEIDFVYPNELHFFTISGYDRNYPLGARFPPPNDYQDFARNALSLIERASEGNSPFAPFDIRSTLKSFRSDVFLTRIERDPAPKTDRERLLRYLDAAAAAFGHDLSFLERPVRLVEKSVSNIEFAAALKQLFPDSLFVHVIRNPHANVVAIRRASFRHGSLGKLRPFIQAIRLSLAHAMRNRSTVPGYHVVRYEDLVQQLEPTVRDLCYKVGIRYSPSMLSPTVFGHPWGGNSTSGVKFTSEISERPLTEWKNQIMSIETELTNRHLSDLMRSFGYATARPRQHWLAPCVGERPTAYLANRQFLWQRRP